MISKEEVAANLRRTGCGLFISPYSGGARAQQPCTNGQIIEMLETNMDQIVDAICTKRSTISSEVICHR